MSVFGHAIYIHMKVAGNLYVVSKESRTSWLVLVWLNPVAFVKVVRVTFVVSGLRVELSGGLVYVSGCGPGRTQNNVYGDNEHSI